MKKLITVLLAVAVCVAFSGVSFAADKAPDKKETVKLVKITGEIASIDKEKSCIVVKAEKDKKLAEETINVDKKVLESLKVGEKVTVTLKEGSNKAEKVEAVKTAKKSTKMGVKIGVKKEEPKK